MDDDRRTPVRERDPRLSVRRDRPQPQILEPEILDHRHHVEELHVLGMHVVAEPRQHRLLGVGAAALLVATLHHDRRSPARWR